VGRRPRGRVGDKVQSRKVPPSTVLGAAAGVGAAVGAGGAAVGAVGVGEGAFWRKGAPIASSSVRSAASPAPGSVTLGRSFSSPTRSIPVNKNRLQMCNITSS